MKCPKCGNSNPADSQFCTGCGAKLTPEKRSPSTEGVPAQQAEKVVKNIKSLTKKLSLGEKIIGVGALLSLVSFFLPWVSNPEQFAEGLKLPAVMTGKDFGSVAYLIPVLMIVSLGLLYFSIGAGTKTKIKYSSYQILIGSVFGTTGIVLRGAISKVKGWFLKETFFTLGGYGEEAYEEAMKEFEKIFRFEFGIWLLILGCLAIIVGAFLTQRQHLGER